MHRLAFSFSAAAPFLVLLLSSAVVADHHDANHHESSDESHANPTDKGWIELFNGRDLTGWRVSENPETFRVEDGAIIANGPRAHAFYVGAVGNADFQDFELLVEVITKPGSNSGIFFHTKYQEEGWPNHGYEMQINQTQGDRIKTGSLYKVKDVLDDSPAKDNEWYTQHLIVRGKHVVVKVDGEVVNEYTEPEDVQPPADRPGRHLSHGTIALQGHDPDSEVHFRSVKIKLLD
ncbi:MAG: DUF1080 domain-containing protein [Planctomycetota bacterium]